MARAFEVILHNGKTSAIYNIGGTHEKANIEVGGYGGRWGRLLGCSCGLD